MDVKCPNQKSSRGQLGIITCRAGEPFGKKIFSSLKDRFKKEGCVSEGPVEVKTKETHFPNTELKVEIENSVRGMDLYVVQDVENKELDNAQFTEHIPLKNICLPFALPEGVDPEMLVDVRRPYSVDENLRALLTVIDAAKRADAHYVSAVLPVFPYARQDKAISRECITASRIAQEIEDHKADRVLTLDIHNTAISGFFRDIPCENLHSSTLIMDYMKSIADLDNLVVISPDEGSISRANFYAKRLGTKLAMGYKKRDYSRASHVDSLDILGKITREKNDDEKYFALLETLKNEGMGRSDLVKRISEIINTDSEQLDVLFVDDMIATAGSLVKGVEKVAGMGAKNVWFACALPLFTYPAMERIDRLYDDGKIKGVIGTNAVFHHPEEFKKAHPWYHEVAVEKYFADAMFNINHYRSISDLLK